MQELGGIIETEDNEGEILFYSDAMNMDNTMALDIIRDLRSDLDDAYEYLLSHPKSTIGDYMNSLGKDSPHFKTQRITHE